MSDASARDICRQKLDDDEIDIGMYAYQRISLTKPAKFGYAGKRLGFGSSKRELRDGSNGTTSNATVNSAHRIETISSL